MNAPTVPLSSRRIAALWLPMMATWLMMSLEGPVLSALIARMSEPAFNLAAYGVAFALALVMEAPVIMLLSAATKLVEDAYSYRQLRNYTTLLNLFCTGVMLVLVAPPVFDWLARDLIQLPDPVAKLTHIACVALLPWPGAIGYRRFYQGVMIRQGQTRRVAYGTVLRLTAMLATGASLFLWGQVEGVLVGAGALSTAVLVEVVATRLMARQAIRAVLDQGEDEATPRGDLGLSGLTRFYVPLALTPLIALGAHPVVTFFLGQSREAIASLAVYPVITSLVFIFRSVGLSYVEVTISLLGKRFEHFPELRRFALILGVSATGLLTLIAATPLSELWFETVSGLAPRLAGFAILPTLILALIPGLSVLLGFQRAILISSGHNAPITWATVIEVVLIVSLLWLLIQRMDMIGVTGAAIALTVGRLGANLYLTAPFARARRRMMQPAVDSPQTR